MTKWNPESIGTEVAQRVASLIHTSGTTGPPKGVMLTHRNLLFVAAMSARIRCLSSDDRLYGVLPMSHAVGLSVVLLGSVLRGSTLYLASRFGPVAAVGTLERERLTVVLGAPGMFAAGELCEIERTEVVQISCASESFPPVLRRFSRQSNRGSRACLTCLCTTDMASPNALTNVSQAKV